MKERKKETETAKIFVKFLLQMINVHRENETFCLQKKKVKKIKMM